jgi:hypothetical protein
MGEMPSIAMQKTQITHAPLPIVKRFHSAYLLGIPPGYPALFI